MTLAEVRVGLDGAEAVAVVPVQLDWDEWRARYDLMTFADQQAFYDAVYRHYPGQGQFSVRALSAFLDHIGEPVEVVELGGWDGEYAAAMLAGYPEITGWTNYEISNPALVHSVCDDPRYCPARLDEWYWETPHRGDLFVASHVLEHLRQRDVERVFACTDVRWMYLQSPLRDGPTDWYGYHGSHILEVGWGALIANLAGRGYRRLKHLDLPNARCFEKAG